MTRRSKEGAAAIRQFTRQFIGGPCWYCELREATDIHHIVKRRGLIYDDLRNFFACCRWCHDRIEGSTLVTRKNIRLLPIPVEVVLELKRRRDGLDLAFLRLLAGPGDGRLNMEFGRGME